MRRDLFGQFYTHSKRRICRRQLNDALCENGVAAAPFIVLVLNVVAALAGLLVHHLRPFAIFSVAVCSATGAILVAFQGWRIRNPRAYLLGNAEYWNFATVLDVRRQLQMRGSSRVWLGVLVAGAGYIGTTAAGLVDPALVSSIVLSATVCLFLMHRNSRMLVAVVDKLIADNEQELCHLVKSVQPGMPAWTQAQAIQSARRLTLLNDLVPPTCTMSERQELIEYLREWVDPDYLYPFGQRRC